MAPRNSSGRGSNRSSSSRAKRRGRSSSGRSSSSSARRSSGSTRQASSRRSSSSSSSSRGMRSSSRDDDDRRREPSGASGREDREGGARTGERGAWGDEGGRGEQTPRRAGSDFGGEVCRECGAPIDPASPSRSSRGERRGNGGRGDYAPRGLDERMPGMADDVERPSGASRRGNRGYESDEPRTTRRGNVRRDVERPGPEDSESGPDERGGFDARGV